MKSTLLGDGNKSALDYHIATVQRVKKICEPLKYLGVSTFGYLKIFDDAHYLHICNQDEWSQYYFHNVHDNGEVFTKAMPLNGDHIHTFPWSTDTSDYLLFRLKENKIWHGYSFYKRTDNYVEVWSFATEPDNTQITGLYFRQEEILWKFVQYFMTKAADLVDHSDPLKLAFYKNGVNIIPSSDYISETNVQAFLKEIELKRFLVKNNEKNVLISAREKDCLKLISNGQSFKEAARQMNISPRTVEKYLNNVKIKLGVNSKHQLIKVYDNLLIGRKDW